MHILPRLPAFLAGHPGITIETDVTDRHVNLIADRIDVAIRIGALSDFDSLSRGASPVASSA